MSYWPAVKAELQKWPIPHQSPHVVCPICDTRLWGITDPATFRAAGAPHLPHTVILQCGHMFGKDCLHRWFETRVAENLDYTCPLCRALLTYSSPLCPHPVSGIDIIIQTDDPEKDIPLTLPEGGTAPHMCMTCRYDMVDASEEILAKALFKAGPAGSLMPNIAQKIRDVLHMGGLTWEHCLVGDIPLHWGMDGGVRLVLQRVSPRPAPGAVSPWPAALDYD